MELNEKSLKKILSDQQSEYKNHVKKVMDEQRGIFKSDVAEFSREVGVMFEHTNSKIEFIAEKLIGIEEKLDAHMIDQAGINKGFDGRITKVKFEVSK